MSALGGIGNDLDGETVMKAMENVRRAERVGLLTTREANALCRTFRVAYRQDAGLKQFPEDLEAIRAYEADPDT
jgi:hypothetical protein